MNRHRLPNRRVGIRITIETLAHSFRDFRMEPDFLREVFEVLEESYSKKDEAA